jgi:predicted nuclease of predicted toxin-antitoxin system
MNLLADESVDGPIVDHLRQEGHRVWYIAEMEPGVSDDFVLDLANREHLLLLTADKDFGELVYRQHRLMSGVVLIRLAGLPSNQKAESVASVLHRHAIELPHAFTVITPKIVRIRKPRE